MRIRSHAAWLVPLLSWLSLLAGCTARPARERLEHPRTRRALETYADIAEATYGDALRTARDLRSAVAQLLERPSAQTLERAQRAWRTARVPYAQSEVFRFYGGPIDRVEFLVNTWPIDENYVEGTSLGPDQGLVGDSVRHPTLDASLLLSMNGRDGETSVSTGYHVIEFLLWGRDTRSDGPGGRLFVDFIADADNPLNLRRRRYLELATDLLVEHLGEVTRAWRDDYRARFLALPRGDALALVLRGMGSLSGPELRGERLTVPYETRDQENEHSCFSDTTHLDLAGNVVGIENVCLGRYRSGREVAETRGPGICELLGSLDRALGSALEQQIADSIQAAQKLPAPFDRALVAADDAAERLAIKHLIATLGVQTETLTRAASLLGTSSAQRRRSP